MLHDDLKKLNKYPFHMPGHKRNPKFGIIGSEIDITEIEGFDNLHDPQHSIKETEEALCDIYSAKHSFLSVGGSTLGMLCAICAVCEQGDTLIVARNCHKSVWNACLLKQLQVVILEPEFDAKNGCYRSVKQEKLDALLARYPRAKAVVITSPTYEGYLSDIHTDIPLIVDAAHGAHLGIGDFSPYPKGSIVVSSLHKTLPALTQTAVINVYDESYIRPLAFWLDILETSSPSYVLMNSVSVMCQSIQKHPEYFENHLSYLRSLRKLPLQHLVIEENDDISKLFISTAQASLSGGELADIFRRQYGMEVEMATPNYIVLITSIGDEKKAFENLSQAFAQLDASLQSVQPAECAPPPAPGKPFSVCVSRNSTRTPLNEAQGKTANEFIYAYPPDIPLLIPGEKIHSQTLRYLLSLHEAGSNILSDSRDFPNSILTK